MNFGMVMSVSGTFVMLQNGANVGSFLQFFGKCREFQGEFLFHVMSADVESDLGGYVIFRKTERWSYLVNLFLSQVCTLHNTFQKKRERLLLLHTQHGFKVSNLIPGLLE